MPKTVEDVLKESGMTEEQIKALDAKVLSGMGSVLTTAQAAEQQALAAKEFAENTLRAQKAMLETEINPALDIWATEKANMEAQLAFYRTQNEQARIGGFIPQDAPGYKPPVADPNNVSRGTNGQFVAGQNPVPGSPKFVTQEEAYKALSYISDITNDHIRLFGGPPPDRIDTIVKEAVENHYSDPYAYAAKKYNFDGKKQELSAKAQQDHDDKIRKDAIAERDKHWAEKQGNNPNLSPAVSSQFSELNKAVSGGQRKDPLAMSASERHQATRSAIQTDIAQRETVQ